MRTSWLVLTLGAAACGGHTPGPGGASGGGACPATFAEAQASEACGSSGASCGFPEGTCSCVTASSCGGSQPSPEEEAELAAARPTWHCTRPRTDGCPDEMPTGACAEPEQQCAYGDCCITTATCTDGAWVVGASNCPP